MKLLCFNNFLEKREPWIICIILVGFSNLDIPFFLTRSLRIFSYIAIFLIFIKRRDRIIYILSKNKIIVLLHVLALASVFWSVSPYITITRFIALLRTTLVGVIFATYTPQDQAKLFSYIFVISGLLSLLAVAILPSHAIQPRTSAWFGIFIFKNHLGMMMAYGSALFLSRLLFLRKRSVLLPVSLLGAITLLIFSQSSTSLVAFSASLLLIPMYITVKQGHRVRAVYFVLIILGIFILSLVITSNLSFLVEDVLGKDLTLTGRNTLWDEIISQVLKRPWLGYGYHAFWYSEASLEAVANNGWPSLPPPGEFLEDFHSHNGYIEMLSGLGFLGLGLLIVSCITVFFRALKYLNLAANIEGLWMLQILTMIVIVNYSEAPSLLRANSFQWILYVSTSFSLATQLEKLKKEKLGNNLYFSDVKIKNPYLMGRN